MSHLKLSISTDESYLLSPSSKMMNRSLIVSPGVTGAVVLSQPVPPPTLLPYSTSARSYPVIASIDEGLVHVLWIITKFAFGPLYESHTSKKPLLMVTGWPCES